MQANPEGQKTTGKWVRLIYLLPIVGLAMAVGVSALVPPSWLGSAREVRAAPSQAGLNSIVFSQQQNGPSQSTYTYGPRAIWAAVDYRDAQAGQVLRWVLWYGSTDVNFGNITTNPGSGRADIVLERMDREPLMPGVFDLIVYEGDTEIGRASFDIYEVSTSSNGGGDDDDDDGDDDNGDDDNDDEDNDDEDNQEGDDD